MTPRREYDLVLFGATGFTGQLTAEYLAANAPAGCRWALAGRNRTKLEDVRARLGAGASELPLIDADITDSASVATLAQSTRVLITTVGPYANYGEPLVAACAEAGTDYVDITGEPEFVDRMYLRHHERAVETGARIVHSCGFDSIPYDLGVYFAVQQLPDTVPITIDGIVRASGKPSGGTYHSVITAFSRSRSMHAAARDRKAVEPRPDGRRARAVATGIRHVDGLWLVPLPTIDQQVVARSARALPEYGPDFTYHHYAGVRHLATVVGGAVAFGGLFGLAQLPPTRRLLLDRIKPGDGPSPERRAEGWFRVRFIATGGGRRVVTEVSGGDPGYQETSKMLAESALCLAFDDLPIRAGQLTTATAMGQPLIDRLVKAGIEFRVLSSEA